MNIRFTALLLLAQLCCLSLFAQSDRYPKLTRQIDSIAKPSHAKIGVAVTGLGFNDSFTYNGTRHFPMLSVYKFPLALAVLHQVDTGAFALDQMVHIRKEQLDTTTWSPIADKYAGRDIDMPLSELLRYTVGQSDNNGCDVLFELMGGTVVVNDYIHSISVKGIAIKTTEAEMAKGWKVPYTNWCEPVAMLQLLKLFHEGRLLSEKSNGFLMDVMINSVNDKRLKGQLPAGTVVAHKTGTSNSRKNFTVATNDVGIITLPGGRRYAIVIYVSDYKGKPADGEKIIAAIPKLVWDSFQ